MIKIIKSVLFKYLVIRAALLFENWKYWLNNKIIFKNYYLIIRAKIIPINQNY
jgi:hypothetical protein